MRLWLLLGTLCLLTMIACRTEGPQDGTRAAPTVKSPALVPQEVPMTTLLRNRDTFEGQTIRLTGQYRSLPLLVCGSTIHRSPATWTLVFGDIETFVSGFDEALRPLAASGLSLTIEGRWQKWEGPVGCGRRAPSQEVWYLAASRIISPNPLVKSDSGEEVVVLLSSPTPDIAVVGTPISQITPAGLPTAPNDEEPSPETTENDTPTPNPSPTFQLIPTDTPRPTATTSTGSTSAVTDTPTPTATTSGSTPSATAAPNDQGMLDFDTVEKQSLSADSSHSWRFSPPTDEPIIITVGSGLNLDIKLDLFGPDGTLIESADRAGMGEAETITYTTSDTTGEYMLVLSANNASTGPYVLMLFDSDSEPIVIMQETLTYGSGGSGSIPDGVDHFWNFEGQAGDTITIEVSPTSSDGDLIFYLIGPEDGIELEFINETGVGESESLISYVLPESGFYSIGIGENDFFEIAYTITLSQ